MCQIAYFRVEFLVYPEKTREGKKKQVNISSTVVVKATKQRISLWWCQIQKFSRFTHENQTEFTKRGLLKNSPENMLNRSTKSWKQRKQVVFILDMVLDNRAQVHPILLIWVTDEDQICSKIQKSGY